MSTPITFNSIHLRNFMSFGNAWTEIDLSTYGSTLILGENADAGSKNGAGKTTIINAVCYALYNNPFDNISLQRLINASNNSKNTLMEVRLFLTKGDDEYQIYRCRGETFNIQVLRNGEDITLDSVSGNDKLVEEIIGMSYALFTKIIIFSGTSVPFLLTPVSQQRAQIEELFNITILTEKAVKLKEAIKQTENDIAIQTALNKQQEAAVSLYNKQRKDAQDRITKWDETRVSQLAKLKDQLNLCEGVDMTLEKELHAAVSGCKEALTDVKQHFATTFKDQQNLLKEIIALDRELTHLLEDKCPYCLQGFLDASDKLEEKRELRKQKSQTASSLQTVLNECNNSISANEKSIAELAAMLKFKTLEEAIRAQAAASSAQQKIDDLQAAVNPHIEAYESLSTHTAESVSYDSINALKKLLDHQQFLLKLLVDKNSFIRRKIINRTIPRLNERLIKYTRELGLPHIVKFDDDMSCAVSEYGRELDFGNLSSGEKKRVNFSLSLAFRDILHHLHAKVNCLFVDEIDASLDDTGVEATFKLIKQKTRDDGLATWIISHRPEAIGRFDRTITVRKENGFSQIVE